MNLSASSPAPADDDPQGDHWVSRLFPPHYQDADQSSEEELKTVLGDQLSAIDPDALKNVFRRVHSMLKQQKESERRKAVVDESVVCTDVGTVTVEREPDLDAESLDGSCIWDEAEISLLRKAYKSLRDENRKLKSQLQITEQRYQDADSKYNELRDQYRQNNEELTEKRQINLRLDILSKNLKKKLLTVENENELLIADVKSLKSDRSNLTEQLKQAKMQTSSEQTSKELLERKMSENGRVMLESVRVVESKLKVEYERKLNEVNQRLADVMEELSEERRIHAANRRALDHLRQHFSSLPPVESRNNDDLNNLQHY